jgi:3-keto-disaccharide hydrolase
MQWMRTPSRHLCRLTLSACVLFGVYSVGGLSRETYHRLGLAHAADLKGPKEASVERFDFEQQGIEGWKPVDGRWTVEEMSETPRSKRVLVQRAVENPYNVIVAPSAPYTDVDVSVRFKPMAGREDVSGGIVFRFAEGHYYVVRANALENNFRLYYYDRGRHQLATASVQPPALGQWHTIRVVAVGDHIQAYLNGALRLEHRDSRYRTGQVGLWTKADSITAFDDFVVRGVHVRP